MTLDKNLIGQSLKHFKEAFEQTRKDYSKIEEELREKRQSTDYYKGQATKEAEIGLFITLPLQYWANFRGKNYWKY